MLSKNQIQNVEQRSIALFNESEGPQSLPAFKKTLETKTEQERANVLSAQSNFKRNGLREWNDRNRPGNNK